MASIRSVIDSTLIVKPNSFGDNEQAKWIYELEQKVSDEIFGIELPTDLPDVEDWEEPLTIKGPYERLYQIYVEAMIDYHLQEFEAYNNAIIYFNSLYKEFLNSVSRKGIGKKWYWKGVI